MVKKNKGNDHIVSILGNVLRTVWRICILMLGCNGLTDMASQTTQKKKTGTDGDK